MKQKMDAKKRFLMWSILLIAMVQMPNLALTPGIDQIHTTVFPDRSLSTIQTVMQIPNLISPFLTITAAWLISRGLLTKRASIIGGLFLVGATGALALIFNTRFWHLVLLSCCLGVGLSGYISAASSLIVDHFTEGERQTISGYQTSFINGGGIVMSLCGGLLATLMWYGGYMMLLLAVPVAVIGLFAIPRAGRTAPEKKDGGKRGTARLHPDVFLYGAFIFVFMLVYCVIGSNLSTHMSGMGNTAVSGYATAIQMCGGVVCGIFFGRLSRKLGDYTCGLAFLVIFAGMLLLSLFPDSIAMTCVAVFIAGTGMSLMLPECMFSVSKVVTERTSALATSVTSCICPGFGGFFSAMVFTNLTTRLYGESTVLRYRFVSFVALVCAAAVFAVVAVRASRAGKAENG